MIVVDTDKIQASRKKSRIVISEVYGPVIQGEGMVVGRPTVFVRTAGCDYRCGQNPATNEFDGKFVCDSLYAVLPQHKATWTKMTAEEIMNKVVQLTEGRPILITLSGGNPALQPCEELIDLGHSLNYKFAIETQGSILPAWAHKLNSVTISPKPPSSYMETDWDALVRWIKLDPIFFQFEICVKVVVFDDEDFEYAAKVRQLADGRGGRVKMYLQAGTTGPYQDTSEFMAISKFRDKILDRTDWLGRKVIEAGWYDVRVLPQVHALLYGAKRGV